MTRTLTSYWWRPDVGYNLGDELTPLLLAELFNVSTSRASLKSASLLSTGSVLGWIWGKKLWLRRQPLGVVGSGFMHPGAYTKLPKFAAVYSVRGHLSRHILPETGSSVSLGDPGLLVSRLKRRYADSDAATFRYGLIGHHSTPNESSIAMARKLHDCRLIDFGTLDLARVIDEMCSCETIISQGLHGLILADSLGIPNVWLNDRNLHRGGDFKFHDYFSSVDRPFELAISSLDDLTEIKVGQNIFTVLHKLLRKRQAEIEGAFSRFLQDFVSDWDD